jgi:hypothetical protein
MLGAKNLKALVMAAVPSSDDEPLNPVQEGMPMGQGALPADYTDEELLLILDAIGAEPDEVDLAEFRMGMEEELEHGTFDPQTDVTGDDQIMTAKIALVHLRENPRYYSILKAAMEAE